MFAAQFMQGRQVRVGARIAADQVQGGHRYVELVATSVLKGDEFSGLVIDIQGQDVILVEDIVDTGMTLNYLTKHLKARGPATVEVCTLLDKKARRLVEAEIRYVGFDVPDEFLVGYGLDYLERYRNLPFIGVLKPGPNGPK